MEDILLSEIGEIIHRAALEGEITISGLSRLTGISRETVRAIMLYFYEYPFGGMGITCKGVPASADIMDMAHDVLDDTVKWRLDISAMDKVPVEHLNEDEIFVLKCLIFNMDGRCLRDVLPYKGSCGREASILTKGTNESMLDMFKFKHFSAIKKALLHKLCLEVVYGELHEAISLKPLGLVYHSEEDNWYLICRNEKQEIHPYEINKFESVRRGSPFQDSGDFDMREYLRQYFGFEREAGEDVEVVFMDDNNVIEKVKRRLEGKGSFLEGSGGELVFKGKLKGIKAFKAWVLGFGCSAIVIRPEWLKEEILAEQKKIIENYSNVNSLLKEIEDL